MEKKTRTKRTSLPFLAVSRAVHRGQDVQKGKQAEESAEDPERDSHDFSISRPPFRGWWRIEPRIPFADASSPRVVAKGKASSTNGQRQSRQPIYQRNQKLQILAFLRRSDRFILLA